MDRPRTVPEKKHQGFGTPLTEIRKAMLTRIPLPNLPPELDSRTLWQLFDAHPAPDLAIRHLLRDGSLIRVRRGIYAGNSLFQARPWSAGVLAAMMCQPSCVSGSTALWYHGFVVQAPAGCESVCPGRSRTLETSLGPFNFYHLNAARYGFGHHLHRLPDGASFFLADPEKALLDAVCRRTGISSLKRLKAVVLGELALSPSALARFDLVRLRVYARRYNSAMAVKLLVPWVAGFAPASPAATAPSPAAGEPGPV